MEFIKETGPTIMGILNLTPDSFSDGGEFNTIEKALRKVSKLEKEGADIIDIGGESTGPGSKDVSLEKELNRVIPLLREIRKHTKLPISIDTYKSQVAKKALEEGADMINDVTALRGDPSLAKVIAHYKCPIILMYSKIKQLAQPLKKSTTKMSSKQLRPSSENKSTLPTNTTSKTL